MISATKHGLRNLVNFRGRDTRPAFWFFALFVYLVIIAISMVVVIPLVVEAISDIVREATAAGQSGDPVAAEMRAQAVVGHAITGLMSKVVGMGVVTNLLVLAALAASFVRRLHDSDLSGWWALIPGTCQIAAASLAPSQTHKLMQAMGDAFASTSPEEMQAKMQALQSSMAAYSALGWIAILAVILLGIREPTKGPNRFGAPAPVI